MLIVWGSYSREKERGIVGDRCIHCDQVTSLLITDFYRVPHVYFIPLGGGSLVATVLTCANCRGQAMGTISSYQRLIPRPEAQGMTIGQILAETNPPLHDAISHRANLEARARACGDDVQPGEADARLELALARLDELDYRRPEVAQLRSQLEQWHSLDADGRARILRDLDSLIDDQEKRATTFRFIGQMAGRFKPELDLGVAILTFAVVTILGIVAAALIFSDRALAIAIFTAIGVGIALAIAAHVKLRRDMHRRFFRKTFLPEAHLQGVDVTGAIDVLRELDPRDRELDPNVRGLVQALPLLDQVVLEAHADGDVREAAATFAALYPKERNFRKRGTWTVPLAIVGIVAAIVFATFWIIQSEQEKHQQENERIAAFMAPFQQRLAEYVPPAPPRDLQEPYRRGRVMPINLAGNKSIDAIFTQLPPALRPETPDDVGTIVWLQWGTQVVGRYRDNVSAFVVTCQVTIIDKSTGKIIAERAFVGGDPPATRRKRSDANTGSNPTPEIINWLAALPVKG